MSLFGSLTGLLHLGGSSDDGGLLGGVLGGGDGGIAGGVVGDVAGVVGGVTDVAGGVLGGEGGDLLGGALGTVSGVLGNVLGDDDNGLLGGHGSTLVDTGSILGEADGPMSGNPIIDLDLDSAPRETPQGAAVNVGILPQIDGHTLLDADLLSGSYGAHDLLTVDLGPDGFGPVLTGTILGGGDNPLDLQLLGTPITDALGGDGGLLGGLL